MGTIWEEDRDKPKGRRDQEMVQLVANVTRVYMCKSSIMKAVIWQNSVLIKDTTVCSQS